MVLQTKPFRVLFRNPVSEIALVGRRLLRLSAVMRLARSGDHSSWAQRAVEGGQVDFLDLGTSRGGSIRWAERYLGGKLGLGVDLDRQKVLSALKAGYPAIVGDALDLPRTWEKKFRFTQMLHFLEHLEDSAAATRALEVAVRNSRDFIFVKQPYFDADRILASEGFKLYWSDWDVHPNNMLSSEFLPGLRRMLKSAEISGFEVRAHERIESSEHWAVHSVGSPRNQHQYDPEKHPPKRRTEFPFDVFRELWVLIWLPGTSRADIRLPYESQILISEGSK